MKKRLFSWGLLGMSLALPSLVFDLPSFLPVLMADSSCPAKAPQPPGPGVQNNNWGPCTDQHKYISQGIGNGTCGRCGNVTWTYTGGICFGQQPCGPFNCLQTSYPATITDTYISTPAGAAAYAACFAATSAMFFGNAALAVACGPVCISPAGVFTGGLACWACIAGTGALGVAITCFYSECSESCNCTNTAVSPNNTSGCW